MYVQLGGELVVLVADVVAILDARLLAASEINREFVERAVAGKRLPGGGMTPECKALVVTRNAVLPATVSAGTLARRVTHVRQPAQTWDVKTPR